MNNFRNPLSVFIALFSLFFMTCPVQAQNEDYYREDYIRNDNATYKENIRTVLLYKMGFELSPPVIQLFSDERLVLSFDDMDGGYKTYKYTLQHCDAFWNPSSLQQMEYIEGFFEDDIKDYKYSYNTTIPYTNYVLVFPTDYMKIKRSGNYILRVFVKSDRDENVVLTRRFMVYEPLVTVEGAVGNSVDLNLRYTHHQINFKLLPGSYNLTDSHRDMHVFVMQNGRWDNIIQNIQPRSIVGGVFDFTLVNELVFPAGNEFRYLDMKTLKYNTDRMQALRYDTDGYHVYIMQDVPRNKGNYVFEEDINGRRLIAVNGARDPYSEGDYAWVHFQMPFPYPLAEGNLYIAGSFADWQYRKENLLVYNYDLKAYQARILLKQGYYNYLYSFVENRSNTGDFSYIEGNYWETGNEYIVMVYHRRQGTVYDALVGLGFIYRK